MKYILLTLAMLLTGCATNSNLTKEPMVAIKYKYVVVTIPEDLMTVPEPVKEIDPLVADEKEVSIWLLDSEARAIIIEKKLKSIKSYQDKKLSDLDKSEINKEDIIK